MKHKFLVSLGILLFTLWSMNIGFSVCGCPGDPQCCNWCGSDCKWHYSICTDSETCCLACGGETGTGACTGGYCGTTQTCDPPSEGIQLRTTGELNLRSSPAGSLITTIPVGKTVTSLGECRVASYGGIIYNWYKIRYQLNDETMYEGWSASNWLEEVEGSTTSSTITSTTTTIQLGETTSSTTTTTISSTATSTTTTSTGTLPPTGSNLPENFNLEGEDPFEKIPNWFYEKILPNLELSCDSYDECIEKRNLIVPVSPSLKIRIKREYVPPNLVYFREYSLWDYKHPLLRESSIYYVRRFLEVAESQGYDLKIAYGYRSYDEQKEIHDSNPSGSAEPGYSQHQTGLAIDIFYIKDGTIQSLPIWVIDDARNYGIVHPFPGDPPHFYALDALYPGLTTVMLNNGIDPNNGENLNFVLLGMYKEYDTKAKSFFTFCGGHRIEIPTKGKFFYINQDDLIMCRYENKVEVSPRFLVSTGTDATPTNVNLLNNKPLTKYLGEFNYGKMYTPYKLYSDFTWQWQGDYFIHSPTYKYDEGGNRVYINAQRGWLSNEIPGGCRISHGCIWLNLEGIEKFKEWVDGAGSPSDVIGSISSTYSSIDCSKESPPRLGSATVSSPFTTSTGASFTSTFSDCSMGIAVIEGAGEPEIKLITGSDSITITPTETGEVKTHLICFNPKTNAIKSTSVV